MLFMVNYRRAYFAIFCAIRGAIAPYGPVGLLAGGMINLFNPPIGLMVINVRTYSYLKYKAVCYAVYFTVPIAFLYKIGNSKIRFFISTSYFFTFKNPITFK